VINKLFPIQSLKFSLKKKRRCDISNTFINLKRDKETGDLLFVKTIENFSKYAVADHQNLLAIYDLIKTNKIRHTYKEFDFKTIPSKNNKKTIEKVITESKFCADFFSFIRSERDVKKVLVHVSYSRCYFILAIIIFLNNNDQDRRSPSRLAR
jgi:hypothetical protein